MPTATLTASLTYTPPGGATGGASASLSVAPSYIVLSIATLDIPASTFGAVAFTVPFGTIAKSKMVIVKNSNEQAMELDINATGTAIWLAPSGGAFVVANPADSGGGYVTSMTATTTVAQSVTAGVMESFVFGDE